MQIIPKNLTFVSFILLAFLLPSPAAFSKGLAKITGYHKVHFNNGKVVYGQIQGIDEQTFGIETVHGKLQLEWDSVSSSAPIPASNFYFKNAKILIQQGRNDEAVAELHRAIGIDPDARLEPIFEDLLNVADRQNMKRQTQEREVLLAEIDSLRDRFLHAKALNTITQALKNRPNDVDLLELLVSTDFDLHRSQLKPTHNFRSHHLSQLEQIAPDSDVLRGIRAEVATARNLVSGENNRRKGTLRDIVFAEERRLEKLRKSKDRREGNRRVGPVDDLRRQAHLGAQYRRTTGPSYANTRTLSKYARLSSSPRGATSGSYYRSGDHIISGSRPPVLRGRAFRGHAARVPRGRYNR